MAKEKQNGSLIPEVSGQDYIEVFGAREHNLKNIDIRIPKNKLVVFTGVSGSGKSSLAFDMTESFLSVSILKEKNSGNGAEGRSKSRIVPRSGRRSEWTETPEM